MTVKEPAHPLEKRDLLTSDSLNAARIDAIAAKMADEGRFPEAVDYIEITHDKGLLAKAETDAVKRGATWLLQQVDRIRGEASPADRWVALAASAQRAERWLDAVRALQIAGQAEAAEALRAEKCPDYDPFKPLGK